MLLAQMRRYGVLQQNFIHPVVGGKFAQRANQLICGRRGVEIDPAELDAYLATTVELHAHVGVRGGIIANQDRRQARPAPLPGVKLGGTLRCVPQ